MPKGQPSIRELCEAYREARAAILQNPDPMEREIGLAALRLEAEHTYRELVTTARDLRDRDLAPLKEYVGNLTGGEAVERLVSGLDAEAEEGAKKALRDLTASLLVGTATGVVATILGIVTLAAGGAIAAGEAVGGEALPLLFAGGSVTVMIARALYVAAQSASQATSEAWIKTWGWADSLGKTSDAAMRRARELQANIWHAATGGSWAFTPFTDKARTRAKLLVGTTWALLGLGAVLVGVGVLQAYDAYAAEQARLPEFPSPPPTFTFP